MNKRSMMMPALCSILALAGLACEDDDDNNNNNDDVGDDGDDDEATEFSAILSGDAERPNRVTTNMTGEAAFFVNANRTDIAFTLDVENGVDVTDAHIHIGDTDEAGPVVVQLFGPDSGVNRDGRLSDGTITEDDLVGELEGNSIADLVEAMEDGDTYVNVHTVDFPDGEVRGQIEPGPLPGDDVE